MAIAIPDNVRELLDAPNYVHLATLRADGSPRNWVVWVGLEQNHILVCTSDAIWKAKDMRRDPRVANVGHRCGQPLPDGRHPGTSRGSTTRHGMPLHGPDLLQVHKCTIPSRGPDRVCFVIAVEKAVQRTLSFVHNPG